MEDRLKELEKTVEILDKNNSSEHKEIMLSLKSFIDQFNNIVNKMEHLLDPQIGVWSKVLQNERDISFIHVHNDKLDIEIDKRLNDINIKIWKMSISSVSSILFLLTMLKVFKVIN